MARAQPPRGMCTPSPLSDAMGHLPCDTCPVSHDWATCPGSHVLCHMSWGTCPVAHVLGRRPCGTCHVSHGLGHMGSSGFWGSSGSSAFGGLGFVGGHVPQELVRACVNWPGNCMNMPGDGEAPQGLRSARRGLPPASHMQQNRLDVQRCALAGAHQSWCSGYMRLVLVGAFA